MCDGVQLIKYGLESGQHELPLHLNYTTLIPRDHWCRKVECIALSISLLQCMVLLVDIHFISFIEYLSVSMNIMVLLLLFLLGTSVYHW